MGEGEKGAEEEKKSPLTAKAQHTDMEQPGICTANTC